MSSLLDSLMPSFPSDDSNVAQSSDKIETVPLSQIVSSPRHPRRYFNEVTLLELAASIEKFGVLQPVLLRQKDSGCYEIVAGERRVRAARLAGLAAIPAVIKVMTDQEQLLMSLIENLHRSDLIHIVENTEDFLE